MHDLHVVYHLQLQTAFDDDFQLKMTRDTTSLHKSPLRALFSASFKYPKPINEPRPMESQDSL